MKYPTLEQVNSASRYEICRWNRFLDSPGLRFIGTIHFEAKLQEEAIIMDRIVARLKEFGGFTPEISKALGW